MVKREITEIKKLRKYSQRLLKLVIEWQTLGQNPDGNAGCVNARKEK